MGELTVTKEHAAVLVYGDGSTRDLIILPLP